MNDVVPITFMCEVFFYGSLVNSPLKKSYNSLTGEIIYERQWREWANL